MPDEKLLLDPRTVNAVLETLNQPLNNATEACAIVRSLALSHGLKLSDDTEISGGDFEPWGDRGENVQRALQALNDLRDWCDQNEAYWSGWGEQTIPEGAIRWTEQVKFAIELIRDNRSHSHPLPELPDGWFLYKMENQHTGIVFLGDQHEPLPDARGTWLVELQHTTGGKLKSGRGHNMLEAWATAIAEIGKAGA